MGYFKQPNDGLRAVCQMFSQRCSVGNRHWIVCVAGRPQFISKKERDIYYRKVCCTAGCKYCRYIKTPRPKCR